MLVSVQMDVDSVVEAIESLTDAQMDILALQLPDRLCDRVGALMDTVEVIANAVKAVDLYSEPDELDLDWYVFPEAGEIET